MAHVVSNQATLTLQRLVLPETDHSVEVTSEELSWYGPSIHNLDGSSYDQDWCFFVIPYCIDLKHERCAKRSLPSPRQKSRGKIQQTSRLPKKS